MGTRFQGGSAHLLKGGDALQRRLSGRPELTTRERILAYLCAHDGSVESATGHGLTREVAAQVGCQSLGALNRVLNRLDKEGVISRDVQGRRTYRITLMNASPTQPAGGKPSAAIPAHNQEATWECLLSHPKGFLRGCLLLLLKERPGHGYDLFVRLEPFGVVQGDPAFIYREVRWLEGAGLVRQRWEITERGPARRVYRLTSAGERAVKRWSAAQLRRHRLVEDYVSRHSLA